MFNLVFGYLNLRINISKNSTAGMKIYAIVAGDADLYLKPH
jgi:hypothetical protein